MVNAPNDVYEQEADAVADRVMRMPLVSSKSMGTQGMLASSAIQRKCAHCEEEKKKKMPIMRKVESGGGGFETSSAFSSQLSNTKGGGQVLPSATKGFMENRFGRAFSNVRVHTDGQAATMNRDIQAKAFTHGSDIYFNRGQFAPNTEGGKRLLAHELTHTVQQGSVTLNNSVQRSCGRDEIGNVSGCESSENSIPSDAPRFLFRVNCDEFARGNDLDIRGFATQIQNGETIEIHGLASQDGDVIFNQNLSCARAIRARDEIESVLRLRGISAPIRIISHGATEGDAVLQRSVAVLRTRGTPEPAPTNTNICGPNVTSWFINQINTAKSDPLVLAIKNQLQGASRVAARYGFSAERVAEGGVAQKVLAEERRSGSPIRTTEASTQLASSVAGQREFARALNAAVIPLVGAPEAIVLAAIKGAATTWKGLVGTGRKYDFKNRQETLQNPRTTNCPSGCNNTVTICPSNTNSCYVKDVPGNLFYAHLGVFIGWTELTLQLGSQFAQLDSSQRWDPPEDTRMINLGANLPDPLTESALCSILNSNPSIFDLQPCTPCHENLDIQPV